MSTLELEARLDNLLSTSQKETEDIDLFAPITDREECPICMLPLPITGETLFMTCCGKRICQGCAFKDIMTKFNNGVPDDEHPCAFCRQKAVVQNCLKEIKKLLKTNNAEAFIQMAIYYQQGNGGVMQSDTKALEMRIRAADGNADAFIHIGYHCITVDQDKSKGLAFYEVSAKKGSVLAHLHLADFHSKNGNTQISIKHLRIGASAGDQKAMDGLMKCYKNKLLAKEELAQTLRAFQASSDAMKSKDRDDERAVRQRHGVIGYG